MNDWKNGPPPLTLGAWFIVADARGRLHAVQCVSPVEPAHPMDPDPWDNALGLPYPSSEFTHHLPTPIQPPKES